MKKQILSILLTVGISFAVSAKDFPCISKPDEQGKCWTLVKDPRDGQEYLSIKACKPISEGGACHIHYVENSRYKSPSAECGRGRDFYYGCLYSAKEEKLACPDFGVETSCKLYFEWRPTYEVTSREYAKIRKKILNKKLTEVKEMFFYHPDDRVAKTPCHRAWVNVDGKWGETTIVKKKFYYACEFWVPGE